MNEMRSVKIRPNQYDPGGELLRLVRNGEVAAGYRYTLGILSWLRSTLLPDRLLAGLPVIGGGDHFNPFTHTVNVYSGESGVLLHEAGHAKDYLDRAAVSDDPAYVAEVRGSGACAISDSLAPFVGPPEPFVGPPEPFVGPPELPRAPDDPTPPGRTPR